MKAPDFAYLRPATLDAALAMLADHAGEAMPLAGGQSLMPMMNFRIAAPAALVDLADIADLKGVTQDGAAVRIGAMTRHVDMLRDPVLADAVPLLGMALPHVAHDAIRNRGTIGGSLALADPAAELPALMLALDAEIMATGPEGSRQIAAADFFLGHYDTVLDPGELIVAVQIPAARPGDRFGFHELAQRHGDYALAGVALAQIAGQCRAAFFGVADRPVRLAALDDALTGGADIQAACEHLSDISFASDTKASAATRRRLAAVALTRAWEGMTG